LKAAVLNELGQVPQIAEFDEPDVKADETLVRVTAAPLKQLDRAIASGSHYSSPSKLPIVCGTDGVGRTQDGSRVYFMINRRPFGAMAELAPASWTVPVPDELQDDVAAAVVNPAIAAWLPLLWRAHMKPGDNVMVLGATGASGRMAVRAARLLGAGRIVAAGRREDVLASLDADSKINLTRPPSELRAAFAREAELGLGIVIDYVWGSATETLLEVLTILGSGSGNFPPVTKLKAFVADIFSYAARGDIGVDVERQSLGDVSEVWKRNRQDNRRVVFCV
jgi:NADPH:quinone reductase-like Zn-dependent oxidoreductase